MGELQPWEQHATVINMPRFDYQAPSSLLHASHSGFLITCTMKREKSATKEAIHMLQKYFNLSTCTSRENLGSSDTCQNVNKTENAHEEAAGEQAFDLDENPNAKRHKISANIEEFPVCDMVSSNARHGPAFKTHPPDSEISSVDKLESVSDRIQYGDQDSFEGQGSPRAQIHSSDANLTETSTGGSVMPSLVKLARNGILFFSLPGKRFLNIIGVLAELFEAINSGELKPPIWCHRILPVQATCLLKEEDLHNVVLKLVKEHIDGTESKPEKPLKFAVGYNTRGMEGNEVGSGGSQKKSAMESSILSRNDCFRIVAGAVKEVAIHSAVDLRSPEMAVLVEVLPLTGLRVSCVAAISVLPGNLVNAKPRLSVKPLVADLTNNKKKQS